MQTQYNKAQHDINETYTFYRQLIDERKHELIKVLLEMLFFFVIENLFSFEQELDNSFSEKQTMLTNQMQKIDEAVERANLVNK